MAGMGWFTVRWGGGGRILFCRVDIKGTRTKAEECVQILKINLFYFCTENYFLHIFINKNKIILY